MTDVNSLRSVLNFLRTPAKSYDDVAYEPTFKASSIFPIMCGSGMSATISFMNYWKYKNEINHISCVATVRDAHGETIKRFYFQVEQDVHSLKFPEMINDLLDESGEFIGSCEIEIFAIEDLKFPYPAVSVFYETTKGVAAVHTASRVFHSIGDMDHRLMSDIDESGFDIHADDDQTPFFCFTNGSRPVPDAKILFTAFNAAGEERVLELPTESLGAYQTRFVFPEEHEELKTFLQGKVGFCKVRYESFGIFPRLMCGNMAHDRSQMTLTHSYYDTSEREEYFESDQSGTVRNAYLAIPLLLMDKADVDLSFYPIFSPGEIRLRASVFDGDGKLLGEESDLGRVISPGTQMVNLNIREMMSRLEIPIEKSSLLSIEGYSTDGKLPTRINFGVNFHAPLKPGTNINTSMQHAEQFKGPKRTYRWLPAYLRRDLKNYALVTALGKHVDEEYNAEVHVQLYTESGMVHTEEMTVRSQTSEKIQIEELLEKANYSAREGEIIWLALETDSPYMNATYLMVSDRGYIGGDHAY